MQLITGGDSFLVGQELADCSENCVSNLTYSALLASKHNLEYLPVAECGYSNSAIARTVINACETVSKDKIVLVGWTFASRQEIYIKDHWYQLGWDNPALVGWDLGGIKTNFNDVVQNYAMSHIAFMSKTAEVYTTLRAIIFLQQYLKSKKIPYLFVLNGDFDLQLVDEDCKVLYNLIDWDNWFLFPNGKSFFEWAKDSDHTIGPLGHPLEMSHSLAFDLVDKKFNQLI
jgi:hypothetical protein